MVIKLFITSQVIIHNANENGAIQCMALLLPIRPKEQSEHE